MTHPNLASLPGRDPNATFPVRTLFGRCSDFGMFPCNIGDETHCIVQVHFEQHEPDGQWTWAWHVHAHESAHLSCRLSDATPTAEDFTSVAQPTWESKAPAVVEWTPTCVDCHHLFGCAEEPHHAATDRVKRRADGHILVHRDHPNFDQLATDPRAIVHSGSSYADCERCGPRALVCDGCREFLESA